jgi:hypothetical protein
MNNIPLPPLESAFFKKILWRQSFQRQVVLVNIVNGHCAYTSSDVLTTSPSSPCSAGGSSDSSSPSGNFCSSSSSAWYCLALRRRLCSGDRAAFPTPVLGSSHLSWLKCHSSASPPAVCESFKPPKAPSFPLLLTYAWQSSPEWSCFSLVWCFVRSSSYLISLRQLRGQNNNTRLPYPRSRVPRLNSSLSCTLWVSIRWVKWLSRSVSQKRGSCTGLPSPWSWQTSVLPLLHGGAASTSWTGRGQCI